MKNAERGNASIRLRGVPALYGHVVQISPRRPPPPPQGICPVERTRVRPNCPLFAAGGWNAFLLSPPPRTDKKLVFYTTLSLSLLMNIHRSNQAQHGRRKSLHRQERRGLFPRRVASMHWFSGRKTRHLCRRAPPNARCCLHVQAFETEQQLVRYALLRKRSCSLGGQGLFMQALAASRMSHCVAVVAAAR